MPDTAEKVFTKGQTVIRKGDDCGTHRTITQVRIASGRYSRGDVSFKLDGDNTFTKPWQVITLDDVTPEMEAGFVKARAKRDREAAKEKREKEAADAYAKLQRETFADQLRAAPEVLGPITHTPDQYGSGGFVGTTIRYWTVNGRGLDTVVAQREERVGVEVRRDSGWDHATGRRDYQWGCAWGGTTYDTLRAGIMAEAIQYAIRDVIPALGDPRPSYDRD